MSLILDGTNGLSDVDGSAATPAIRGSDANTGVFFGTDIVGVSTGGTERVRVDASGNVGIGTSSPASTLHLNTSSANTVFHLTNSTTGTAISDGFSIICQGTTNDAILSQRESANLIFRTADTERARIDSSGNLLVGTASGFGNIAYIQSALVGADKGAWVSESGATASRIHMRFRNPNGQVGSISTSASATAYTTSSDYRLKHDIQPMSGALAKVATLKPVTYKWNADDSAGEGFIAHELAEAVPGCVTGEKDAVDAEGNPVYQGIDTSFLVATLAAAIQELKGINDAQAQIITALTARVEALEGAQA
jgi:hypothetical protein